MLDRPAPHDYQPSLFAEENVLEEISYSGPDSSFLLSQLEVYNWDPLEGFIGRSSILVEPLSSVRPEAGKQLWLTP